MESGDAIATEIKGYVADIKAAYLRALWRQDDMEYARDLADVIEIAERWLIDLEQWARQ